MYHRSCHLPLQAKHRLPNGFVSGDGTLRYECDDRIRWWLKDKDVEMAIEVDDFVPPIDAHRRVGAKNTNSYTGAHVDASCSVSGPVKIKGKSYVIKNALAVRDHGWGTRDWDSLRSHRWNVATFDRDNSLAAMTFQTGDNKVVKFGWVIRHNKVIFAEKIESLGLIAEDGATNHGGFLLLTLTTGEVVEARFEPHYPCIASWVHHTICYDSMCQVTWGDRVGFGVFETTCNIQGGTLRPEVYEDSYGPDGWHKAKLLLV